MSITREQVADLERGDVVELRDDRWPEGTVVRGALYLDGGTLHVASEYIRHYDGKPAFVGKHQTLTVVSRAPRPLYVNHPRTEPVPGDYVHDEDADGIRLVLRVAGDRYPDKWVDQYGIERTYEHLPARLRLLVDGETGTAVTA
jgi:hypothetical protein